MFLKSLEMQGFKSFPDKTVLTLGKGITGVVGPNGSGKSNISDAVRWVLGEQSTKSLRGSKMEDVIFVGTSTRKALGYAEVTLNLDNTDRALNGVDKDDISVTRRYYRSGESEYRINGEECRLKDIHELFMDTGLGRDGYSLVSQGKVADLVSARSVKRRDMLEEAAGISHFRYRRTDATRRLDQAEENLVRLRDILSELEGRIGPLKTQSEKAKKYLVLSAEKKDLEIGLWLYTIEKSRKGLIEQENKLTIASSQYEAAELDLERLENDINSAIAEGQRLTMEIESVRSQTADAEENATAVDGKIAVQRATLGHNAQTIDRIKKDMSEAQTSTEETDKQIEEAKAQIDALGTEIEALRADLELAVKSADEINAQDSGCSEKAREISEKITQKTLALADSKVELSAAQSSTDELKARVEGIDSAINAKAPALDELTAQKTGCENELTALRETASGYENSLSGYEMKIESRSEKLEKQREEIDKLNLDIHQKQARIKMLDDLEKNLDGYQGSVKQVLTQSKRGMLKGIHGTLSQLISVDGDYAVAVETALGAAIQNIVTDSENDAKRAINYLKENRAGRATFLPLSSITAKPFTEKGLEKCDGFVDMADKLVGVDKKYSEIIRSLLGRTAVVETIDDGIAMARNYSYRFKIVTLDGQVLNAGGSMTGGSRGQNVGFLSRMNEIGSLREAVEKGEKELEKKLESFRNLNAELNAVSAELDAVKAELAKTQEDIIRKEGDLAVILNNYESAADSVKDLTQEKQRSLGRIEELAAVISASSASISACEKEIASLTDTLGELDEARGKLTARREDAANKQNEINLAILEKRKDVEAKNIIIEDCERRKEAQGSRVDELNAEIEEIEKANTAINEEIVKLEAEAQALRNSAAGAKERIDSLVKERTAREAQVTTLRSSESEKNDVKEKLSGEIARLEERRDTMQHELETSQNKLYDEYQLTLHEAQDMNIVLEDIPAARTKLTELRNKIRALGDVNPGAVDEYREVSERYEYMSGQVGDIEKSKTELEKLIGELTGKMAEQFREQFRLINLNFGETFRELFDGGRAELVLEDPSDVLESEINIKVQPPGKTVQNIDLLSGGEKGLSAIALLFAILKVTPAPFCIFDEVEAALDDVNVTRYAKYVRRMTRDTQFVLITHRRGTMEEADILYGVTMQEEGVSKMLELHTADMAKKMGLA
ncbi:MAG: chromosome segregation protein SMC [Clostridia bacterium]|nr:chromosome segregation protein SMC [Clostridia bacterium]